MSELTAAERIATGLFGWGPYANEDGRAYEKGESHVLYTGTDPEPYLRDWGDDKWPDFDDERLCGYWVRMMEDAIAEKGRMCQYIQQLALVPYTAWQDLERRTLSSAEEGHWFCRRATTEQCVAAALRVLDCIDIETIKKAEHEAKSKARAVAVLEKAKELKKTMQCNCDLDNWEPERSTGHSHVCRIHKAALRVIEEGR